MQNPTPSSDIVQPGWRQAMAAFVYLLLALVSWHAGIWLLESQLNLLGYLGPTKSSLFNAVTSLVCAIN